MVELLSGWGRYPRIRADLSNARTVEALREMVVRSETVIARGMGRSYGDSSLPSGSVVSMTGLNRMLDFDPDTGLLTCEAGVTFADILNVFVKQGWFPPVTPGTKFVTIGGAIASDVHGKNHHKAGSFSSCVRRFTLMDAEGSIIECSRQTNSDLFNATFGGMGLTGIILETSFYLKSISSAYIHQQVIKADGLEEVMRQFEAWEDWTYSVAWIDCLARGIRLGRSVLMLGEHASRKSLPGDLEGNALHVPARQQLKVWIDLPSFALNRFSVKAFNTIYYSRKQSGDTGLISYDQFFYPLDAVLDWNRIYGSRGFIQYQCVLPKKNSFEGLKKILELVSKSGYGSFLAVLKLFGGQESSFLSFPMEGYTLALDFPLVSGLPLLLDRVNDVVFSHGGRLYLTKDALMSETFFKKTYDSAVDRFNDLRRQMGAVEKFQSSQSKRLGL